MKQIIYEFFRLHFGWNIYQIFSNKSKFFNFDIRTVTKLALINKSMYIYFKENILENEFYQKQLLKIGEELIDNYRGVIEPETHLPENLTKNPINRSDPSFSKSLYNFIFGINYDNMKNILPLKNFGVFLVIYDNIGYPLVVQRIVDTGFHLRHYSSNAENDVYIGEYRFGRHYGDFIRNISFLPMDKNIESIHFSVKYGQITIYEGNTLPKNILHPFVWLVSYSEFRIEITCKIGKEELGEKKRKNTIKGWMCYDKGIITYSHWRDSLERNAFCLVCNCCNITNMIQCKNPYCIKILRGKIFKSKEEKEKLIRIFDFYKNLDAVFGNSKLTNNDLRILNNYVIINSGVAAPKYIP